MTRQAITILLLSVLLCGALITSGAESEPAVPSTTQTDVDDFSHDWTFHIGEGRYGIIGWDSSDIPVTMIVYGSDAFIYAVDCRMVAASILLVPAIVVFSLVFLLRRRSKRTPGLTNV